MKPLPKFPVLLKILWFLPFPALLLMLAAAEWATDPATSYSALRGLSLGSLFFLLAASTGTVVWLSRPDFATDSRAKCK